MIEPSSRFVLANGLQHHVLTWTPEVVKHARPKQDLRFDLPVVGPKTFQTLAKVKASVLGIESGKTLFLDYERCVELANKSGISIVGA